MIPTPQHKPPILNHTPTSTVLPPLPPDCGEDFSGDEKVDLGGKDKARARTPFPFDVQALTFENKIPEDGFTFMNPSIVMAPENNRYLIAVREASHHFCPGHVIVYTGHTFESRVLFGVADNPRGPVKYCSTFSQRSPVYRMFYGPEDPRFIYLSSPGKKGKKTLYMTYVLDGTMHLSQVHYTVSKNGCKAKETNRLQMWVSGTNKNLMQKNWMFIPDSTTPDGKPLFAYQLNPLKVLAINMKTGEGRLVSAQHRLDCVPSLRGSTMFLHHPTKPNVFIGIAHETVSRRRNYYSRVIMVEEFKPQLFRLTGMSDRFGIPSHNDNICVDRIHFPSSMMYADDNKETIVIGMGYQDCTIHTVQVKTSDLLSSVKPLSC